MKTIVSRFKSYCPDQILLLPPDMKQWLPEGDLAYFIMDVVSELDLTAIYNHYSSSPDSIHTGSRLNIQGH